MPKAVTPKNFEDAMQQLETLVRDMENGNLPLEAALSAYQQGSALVKFCQSTLTEAEQRLQVLDNGMLKDMDTPDE